MIPIETKRLIIRTITEDDTQGIFELDADPQVHQYLGKKPIKSMEEATAIVQYIRNQYKNYGIGRWAVIDKENNEFIGWSGLKYETQVRSNFNYYDLGYRLKKKYWGKGIATETALLSLSYGFEKMNLSEIYAGADIDNIASNKVLQKVGLKFIETFMYDNAPHNWYKITKNDWLQHTH